MTLRWGVGRPTSDRLDRLLAEACQAELTYDHVGSTLDPSANVGRERLVVGSGRDDLDEARARLRRWAPQRSIGADIVPPGAPVEVGVTVVVVARAGPAWVAIPNRIVAVVDEADRFAFAYGSLPGHPFSGEESFGVALGANGGVEAVVAVDTRPAIPLGQLVAPALGLVQRLATSRYLRSLRPR